METWLFPVGGKRGRSCRKHARVSLCVGAFTGVRWLGRRGGARKTMRSCRAACPNRRGVFHARQRGARVRKGPAPESHPRAAQPWRCLSPPRHGTPIPGAVSRTPAAERATVALVLKTASRIRREEEGGTVAIEQGGHVVPVAASLAVAPEAGPGDLSARRCGPPCGPLQGRDLGTMAVGVKRVCGSATCWHQAPVGPSGRTGPAPLGSTSLAPDAVRVRPFSGHVWASDSQTPRRKAGSCWGRAWQCGPELCRASHSQW